jgi:hypothetical protein
MSPNNIFGYATYSAYIRALAVRYNLDAAGLMARCNDYMDEERWEKRKKEYDYLAAILAGDEE